MFATALKKRNAKRRRLYSTNKLQKSNEKDDKQFSGSSSLYDIGYGMLSDALRSAFCLKFPCVHHELPRCFCRTT